MRKRILVLPVAAVLIVLACLYAINRNATRPDRKIVLPAPKTPAKPFELPNQDNERVRLATFLGRHHVLLAFYDGRRGFDEDPDVRQLIERAGELKDRGVILLAVSGALPQENRARVKERQQADPGFKLPFPLLTDLAPEYRVHREWGRWDDVAGIPLTGLFHIDRAGNVEQQRGRPKPVDDPGRLIQSLISGESVH